MRSFLVACLKRHHHAQESVKYTKKNPNLRPFELGGETSLEHYARRTDCGLFVLGSHSKKRQHSLTIGRFYDGQLYDLCELCIEQYRSLQAFGGQGSSVQAGNKVQRRTWIPAASRTPHLRSYSADQAVLLCSPAFSL